MRNLDPPAGATGDAERTWSEQSDKDLLDAPAELGQFIDEKQPAARVRSGVNRHHRSASASRARTTKRSGAEPT